MRIFPTLTALVVAAVLYGIVMERDRLLGFARDTAPSGQTAEAAAPDADEPAVDTARVDGIEAVGVMAMRSVAQTVDSQVILRGETEALREVEVRAEVSGRIVSEPLRKGTRVAAGEPMCVIDPGTSQDSLQEAEARLVEARARLPEARARIAEAEAQLPAVSAAIAEAEANVPAAAAQLAEAEANVPAAAARLAEAEARVPEVQARLREALAGVPAAEAALIEAEARVPEATARMREAEARLEEARINLTAAESLSADGFSSQTRLASARAGFESAKAQIETARAGQRGAEAAVESARSRLEGARAAVESARSQVENARAGIETARSQIEGASAAVESARSRIEGARAAVESARAQQQSAQAALQSARAGEENALAGIKTAEAAIANARTQIARLTIEAPFAGLLESDTAELGALMQPGAACGRILQLDPIKIVGFVPETEVARVEQGAPAAARLAGVGDVSGRVTFVSRSADEVTRTFRVELTLQNDDLRIRDGQTAEIAIEAEGEPAHLLPQSALTLDDDGRLGIRSVAEDGTARFLPVTLLRDTQRGVLVAGLPDTVDVITVGQEYVSDGVPVAPSFEEVIQ